MKTLHSIVLGAAAGLLAACATPQSAPPAPAAAAAAAPAREITAEPGEGRGDAQLQRAGPGQAQALLHDPELPPRRQVRPRCAARDLAQRRRRRHHARVAGLGPAAGGVHRRRHAQAQRQGRDRQRRHHQHLLLRRLDLHVQHLVRGPADQRVLGRGGRRAGPDDRHRQVLRGVPRRHRAVGRVQAVARAGQEVPAVQLHGHGGRPTSGCCAIT